VREKAADPSCCLHCSLAGGRKTMGLYLGFALQLYGRPDDALSHVLVHPPELEMDSAFFYPPPEIGYSDLVRLTQEEFELLRSPMPLIINPTSKSLHIGEITIDHLSSLEFAVYLFLARRRLEGCDNPECPGCEECFCPPNEFSNETKLAQLKAILQEIDARNPKYELHGWKHGEDPINRFREVCSKINRKIKDATGSMSRMELYTIANLPSAPWGEARYGIRLNKRLIKIR